MTDQLNIISGKKFMEALDKALRFHVLCKVVGALYDQRGGRLMTSTELADLAYDVGEPPQDAVNAIHRLIHTARHQWGVPVVSEGLRGYRVA